jgi:hypothetical protein
MEQVEKAGRKDRKFEGNQEELVSYKSKEYEGRQESDGQNSIHWKYYFMFL